MHKAEAQVDKTMGGISSGPIALVVSSVIRTLYTSNTEILISDSELINDGQSEDEWHLESCVNTE